MALIKFAFLMSTMVLLFCHGSNNLNTEKAPLSPEVLSQLDELCKKKGGCCKVSLEQVKKNSYVVLNLPEGPTICPKGTQVNALRCKGSLAWCMPQTTAASPTSQNLDNLCKKSDGCCQVSLKQIEKNSYLVLNVPGGPTTCPKGTQRNQLKCITSLKCCEP